MSYSLLIVDMQKSFQTSQKAKTIDTCKKEIRAAIKNKAAIIFVEYRNYGPTDARLTSLTKNYDRKCTVIKSNNGGGLAVKRAILKNKFPKKNIRVGGVNINYCVYETISQLVYSLDSSKVKVISKACNCSSPKRGFKRLSKLPRVTIK